MAGVRWPIAGLTANRCGARAFLPWPWTEAFTPLHRPETGEEPLSHEVKDTGEPFQGSHSVEPFLQYNAHLPVIKDANICKGTSNPGVVQGRPVRDGKAKFCALRGCRDGQLESSRA